MKSDEGPETPPPGFFKRQEKASSKKSGLFFLCFQQKFLAAPKNP
jgi:hypothetical protein